MPGRALALHFRSNDASFYPTLHRGHSPETDGDHGCPSTGALAQHAKVTEPARISCARCHPRGELPAGNRSRARRQSSLARSRYKASFMLANLQRSSGLMGGYVQRGWRFHSSGIPLESRRGNLWEARALADGYVRDPMLAADAFIDPQRTRTSPPGSWGTLRLYERVEEDGPVHRCAGAATRSLDRAAKSDSEALSRAADRWVSFPPAAPGVPTTTVRRTCPARKSTPTFRNISCRVPSPGRAGGQQSPTRTASKSGRINLVKGIQDSSKPPTFHRIDGSVYIGDMCLSCAELFSI